MTNYQFSVWANGIELDLFDDEEVLVSNNVTGLFDVDKLPSDFTREITIPGSKRNNAFFQHAYDIDVDFPFLFQESQKVECYIDISGYLLTQGYLQLNKINLVDNRVESYDISLYGSVSNFSRDLRNNNLTDLTSLDAYNHTASYDNIVDSWNGTLFSGDIVYPLADYGKGYFYQSSAEPGQYGIDNYRNSLNVQDFKPAIRVKAVVDSIFEQFGYTYTSSFFNEGFIDDMYVICNNNRQFAEFDAIDLEGYGLVKISPTSGSTTDITLNTGSLTLLEFDNTENDPSYFMNANAKYDNQRITGLNGNIKLNFTVSGSTTGSLTGYPELEVKMVRVSDSYEVPIDVDEINKYLRETYSQLTNIGDKTYTLEETWTTGAYLITAAEWQWKAKFTYTGTDDWNITIAKDGNVESYIEVTDYKNGADYRVMEIPQNMPFGENGITCLDFIKALQKKFNLVITPDRQNYNNFKIETFNDWYKGGTVKDLTQFIRTDKPINVIPANNLAVNEIEFSDTLGKDYLARNFNDFENRPYGSSFYLDNENRFSQGKIDVKPITAASPLRYIPGTGEVGGSTAPTVYAKSITYNNSSTTICNDGRFVGTAFTTSASALAYGDVLYWDSALTSPLTGYAVVRDNSNGNLFLLDTFTGQIIATIGNC